MKRENYTLGLATDMLVVTFAELILGEKIAGQKRPHVHSALI